MKPPICTICHEDFFGDGGLIYFKEDDDDKKFNERLNQEGMVGHPTNAFWFCGKHYSKAVKFKHLTKKEALSKIRNEKLSLSEKIMNFLFNKGKK